jgi:Mrp family chromosome partitioning ATPase
MNPTGTERLESEPTVFGSVRRYPVTVALAAVLGMAVAVGGTLLTQKLYQATADVAVPRAPLSMEPDSAHYLDSQVVLMRSEEVASRAARIANGMLGGDVLVPADFSTDGGSLLLVPPEGAQPGSFGSNIVAVSFTWPSPEVAKTGANAFVRAYDELRSAAIDKQSDATVAGIDQAIADSRSAAQRKELQEQRTQALISKEVAIARRPAVDWAVEPQLPVNGSSKRAGAIGLMLGGSLGAALAFARASRRRCFDDRLEPAALYGTPLLGEIPATEKGTAGADGALGADPLPIMADPDSAIAEGYRFVAASVERLRRASGPRLLLAFVSREAGAQTSAVVANTALAVADSGSRVLVVDANPTAGRLTSLLLPGSEEEDGLQQVLVGWRKGVDCIKPSRLHHRLSVLPAGPTTPARVTGGAYSSVVEEVLDEAQTLFDVVLIDSPAMLRLAEASELVHALNVAVVVAVGSDDPMRDHRELADQLRLIDAQVVGYVYRHEPSRRPFGQQLRRLSELLRAVSDRRRRTLAASVPQYVTRSPSMSSEEPAQAAGRHAAVRLPPESRTPR